MHIFNRKRMPMNALQLNVKRFSRWALVFVVTTVAGCGEQKQPQAQPASQEDNREPEPWEARGEQMQKIVQAISDHYDKNNGFPSYVASDQPFYGRPHLSWRVYILPELGHQDLFDQFNTDEPWDSEDNIKLVEKMPDVFLTPEAKAFADREAGSTTIQALAGDGGILASERPGQPPSRKAIVDGLSETALLMECHPSRAVPWTKPDDFPFDPTEDNADATRFGIDGEDFFLIVTVSGEVHRIRKDAEIKEIDRLFQRDDKRETKWSELEYVEKKPEDDEPEDDEPENDDSEPTKDGESDQGNGSPTQDSAGGDDPDATSGTTNTGG